MAGWDPFVAVNPLESLSRATLDIPARTGGYPWPKATFRDSMAVTCGGICREDSPPCLLHGPALEVPVRGGVCKGFGCGVGHSGLIVGMQRYGA